MNLNNSLKTEIFFLTKNLVRNVSNILPTKQSCFSNVINSGFAKNKFRSNNLKCKTAAGRMQQFYTD